MARRCAETSDRIPMWRVPVVQENFAAGRSVRYGAAVIAVWTRCAEGIGEAVAPVEVGVASAIDSVRDWWSLRQCVSTRTYSTDQR